MPYAQSFNRALAVAEFGMTGTGVRAYEVGQWNGGAAELWRSIQVNAENAEAEPDSYRKKVYLEAAISQLPRLEQVTLVSEFAATESHDDAALAAVFDSAFEAKVANLPPGGAVYDFLRFGAGTVLIWTADGSGEVDS